MMWGLDGIGYKEKRLRMVLRRFGENRKLSETRMGFLLTAKLVFSILRLPGLLTSKPVSSIRHLPWLLISKPVSSIFR